MFVNIWPKKKPSAASTPKDPSGGSEEKETAKPTRPTVLRRESRGKWTVESGTWKIDRKATDALLRSLEALEQKDRAEGLGIFSQSVEGEFESGTNTSCTTLSNQTDDS